MKRNVIIFLVFTLIGLALLSYFYFNKNIGTNALTYISVIGSFFTILAFIFAFFASIWAKENKDILNVLLKNYLVLSDVEKNILFNFVHFSGPENKVDKNEFINKIGDIKHKEYFIQQLIEKEWFIFHDSYLTIPRDKKLFVEQIKD